MYIETYKKRFFFNNAASKAIYYIQDQLFWINQFSSQYTSQQISIQRL